MAGGDGCVIGAAGACDCGCCGSAPGVFCSGGGVLCGSGSLSDDEDDESEDDDDEDGAVLVGGRSPSSSSGVGVGLVTGGREPDDKPGSLVGRISSIGGGSSTCIWVASLSSMAVGMAPKSTHLDPVISF